MTVLTDALRNHIDGLIASDRVVLFMKGQRTAPQCGFSAKVVATLDGYLEDYATVDILTNMTLREGLKEYAQWPTFPQLWVDGNLIGGCDIVLQLADQGELDAILGNTLAALPSITLTDAAKGRILSVIEDNEPRLRLRIDARFSYQFEHVDEPESSDVSVDVGGLVLILDRVSARRADGMTMDYVTSPRGSGLVVDNPNEPPSVQQLSVEDFQRWHDEGRAFHLFDVRTEMEWNIARLNGAVLLDDDGQAALEALPKDAPIVFLCHHGVRSQHAAEHFLAGGYRNVFNLTGGIDAWSMRIDPSVPRY